MKPHNFLVHGAATADLPLRILNMFAQQDIAVDSCEIMRANGGYRIHIAVGALQQQRAVVIVEKIRVMVLVAHAELSS